MLSSSFLWGQEMPFEQAYALFGEQKRVKFRQFSLEMTDEGKKVMADLVKKLKQSPRIIGSNLFVIQVYACEKELNVKPYLSVVRGQLLIDYLVENLSISRKKCFIQDSGPNKEDTGCLSRSGANIFIRPNWKNISE